MSHDESLGIAQAVTATVLFSTGAILVRWAAPLTPVEIASLRLLVGGGLVGAAAWLTGQRLIPRGRELRRLLPVGVIAALHFLAFITSLTLTSVAHCLTITYTAPLFIAALSRPVLGEPLPPRTLPGTLLAVVGIAILAGFEPHFTPRMLLGDLCAVATAVTFALYSVLGRRERGGLPVLTYACWVYLLAGALVAPFALPGLTRPVPGSALAAVAAMALFPMALGHTLYNAALRRVHPTLPNLIATQEVSLSILLAWLLLGEAPPWSSLVGAAVTLTGVILVLRRPAAAGTEVACQRVDGTV
jgi:drug/metabolite transporter (DMT)-like permease